MAPPLSTRCWVVVMLEQLATTKVATNTKTRIFFISSPFEVDIALLRSPQTAYMGI
jgi:hypothetical protein